MEDIHEGMSKVAISLLQSFSHTAVDRSVSSLNLEEICVKFSYDYLKV